MWSAGRFLSASIRRIQCARGLKMTITDDGTTIVALHPEKTVPYERSLPLPVNKITPETSPLRLGLSEARNMTANFNPLPNAAAETRERLARLTLTTKHRWFPKSRLKKAKKTECDRPFL